MNKEQISAVIVEFVREIDDVDKPVSSSASFDALGIDSMSTMDLLMRVERELGVVIPDDRLTGVRTIAELAELVATAEREVSR